MTLAQVQFQVAIVFALIATWSALLISAALTMPNQTKRAELALDASPKRCLVTGLVMTILLIFSFVLINLPAGIVKLAGFLMLLTLGIIITIGASGLSRLMGNRIGDMSGAKSDFGCLVRGSLIYSIALLFPLIGWFMFLPISLICSLGAGTMALRPRIVLGRKESGVEQQGVA